MHSHDILTQHPDVDFNMLSVSTFILKNKSLYTTNNGVKYALCVLNDLYSTECSSKSFCNFYISLNNKYHPNIDPVKITITNYINTLRQYISKDGLPEIFKDAGLTYTILDEIEKDIQYV